MTLPPLLSPLRNDLYRAVWCAMLLSYFGVWIQSVGAAWLMTTIAPTVDFVAWVQAANAIPPILFTVFGGVLADRFDQRLILLFSQIAILSMALAIGAFDYFGIITPWLLLILTFALDSGSAIRYPAYQTTVNNLLPREEIPNALVLSSIGWNIARSVGSAFGGLLIASFGAQSAFIANALLNLPIIAVLFRWRRRAGIQLLGNRCSTLGVSLLEHGRNQSHHLWPTFSSRGREMLPKKIRALALLAILPLAFTQQGCQPKANEVAMKVGAPNQSAVSVRSLQTRRFDTLDEAVLLSASIETLQDLGFTVTEVSNDVGVVVASKQRDAEESGQIAGAIIMTILFGATAAVWDKEQTIQVTLTATPIQNSKQVEVRVSFDRNLINNKGQLWRAELLLEPKLYQEFFDKLSQAAFLEAHTI